MQGVVLVDKPADWTSFDVVNYVRKMVAQEEGKKPKNIKVGHTGTLDPFATGLLIVLVGKDYTRRANEFSKMDKTYEVTMKLGKVSSTGDPEGEITSVSDRVPTQTEVNQAAAQFIGEIEQVPPAYSAVKVGGQRAYKLARAGKKVQLEPRRVRVNKLKIVKYEYPDVLLEADVSSGTYLRSLIEDIGQVLKTGAYTVDLRRTKVGSLSIKDAFPVKDLNKKLSFSSLP